MVEINQVSGENFHPDVTLDTELNAHTGSTANPHAVTKQQVGLGNVENVAQSSHSGDTSNPHGVTPSQISAVTEAAFNSHTGDKTNPHVVTKAQLGCVDGSGAANLIALWSAALALTSNANLYYDGTHFRVGNVGGGNYMEVESDGTVEFVGNATVWDDLRIVPGAFDFAGSSDPTLSTWQPGGVGTTFRIYEFNTNDEVFFTCQIPHTYKLGTDLMAHIHWTPRDRGVIESAKTVAWKLDYSIADINEVFPSSSTLDLTDTCSGTDDYHEMTSSVTLDGSSLSGVSAMIVCRLYRDGGDTWANNGAGELPVLLEFDFHYQIDTVGSRQELSK